jgi:hypothetical protein
MMRPRHTVVVALAGALALAGPAVAQTPANPSGANPPPTASPPDAPTPPLQDSDTACMPSATATGGAASLHVEVRDRNGLYPGESAITVFGMDGTPVVTADCGSPWANFRLAPGRYRVSARVGDRTTDTVALNVPQQGSRAVITFAPEPWRDDEVL